MLTYEVEIWSIRSRKNRPKPFELRWRVGTRPHSKSYKTKAQADGRRSELLAALRDRQQFDEESGLPANELDALNSPTWYDHSVAYALMKWPQAAAKQRANIAESLATVTPVFVSTSRGAPAPAVLRMALHQWAYRAIRTPDGRLTPRAQGEAPPAEVEAALAWLAKNSLKLNAAAKPDQLRKALDALSLKLDGNTAAQTTIRRKRTVLNNALRFAVERGKLPANPLQRVDWAAPPNDDEVDFRFVPDARLARALLEAVRGQGDRGEHLAGFFGCVYYAGMRPSEVAALDEKACILPADGWGELVLADSRPEVGSGWTNDGKPYETRGLKRRARNTTRSIPIPPELVRALRQHLKQFGTAEDGRLFRASQGGRVRSTEYTAVWQRAREKALTPAELASPLAAVPYSLRHAIVSLWIKAGVDPVEVARRAGHSVAVLYRFYAKVLHGTQTRANALIEQELDG
ncbi:tyrosine-type recombinase/integrase [Streptomyces lydicus]|uniref:tyrosine-type recombinase/integrase n=1 Tax=Streptomyces lydicus TaxID=47763 RepID=UPI0036E02AB5